MHLKHMKHTRTCLSVIAFSVLTFQPTTAPAAPPSTAASPVDRWRDALGGRERLARISSVHRIGTISSGGLTGKVEIWQSTAGQIRTEVHIGPLATVAVFDGQGGWTTTGDNPPRKLAGEDLARAVTDAFEGSFSQFFPDRRRGSVSAAGHDPTGRYEVVLLEPANGVRESVLLDATTHLPHAIEQPEGDRTATTTMIRWQDVEGVGFPAQILQSIGDPKYDATIIFSTTEINAPLPPSLFRPPSARLVPPGAPFVSAAAVMAQSHVYLPVRLNSGQASWFLVDTGARTSAIDGPWAVALNLPLRTSPEARGSAPASAGSMAVLDARLNFAGIEVLLTSLAAVPLGTLSLREGRPVNGTIGYDVLSRFVTEIDYSKLRLRFFDPQAYEPPTDATAVPMTLHGDLPVITAAVRLQNGRAVPARLLVDTGSRAALTLERHFVEANHILAVVGATINAPESTGIVAEARQRTGRVAALRIAGVDLEQPLTTFSTASIGPHADPEIDGVIGGEALRRFTVVFDYLRRRLYFTPNEQLQEPFVFDASGLVIEAKDTLFNRFIVRTVLPGSPAATAGIQQGDEILSIEDQLAALSTLEEIRSLFLQPDRVYRIELSRNGNHVAVTLRTRRLV